MHRLFILFSLLLLTLNSECQTKNYKIIYRHCLQPDTTKILQDSIGMEAILVGNENFSNYRFAKLTESIKNKTLENDAAHKTTTIDQILSKKEEGQATIKFGIAYDTIGNMVFWDKKSDSIFVREKMMKEYVLTSERTPEIKWNILEETRMIQNYLCLKAITEFRGRKYTAWFTPDLPIAEGPWKFKGLPGLILSIYDDENQVKLYVTSIEFPTTEKVASFVQNGKKVSLATYVDFFKEEQNQQIKNLESMFMNQDAVKGTNTPVINPKLKNKKSFYKIEKRL